jgi:hypothetical protein
MRVIHDARDALINHFEASNRIRPPLVPLLAQHYDCQLAVHFCNCQSPWHSLPFIVSEVWRFVYGAGKAICNTELSIRGNELAESLPITLIESIDLKMQKPRQRWIHFAV